MDMNRAFFLRERDHKTRWVLVDAAGKTLGRLATEIAQTLRGKQHAWYAPQSDSGDYVVVVNAEKIFLSGNKMEDKVYTRYTGWIGGQKFQTARELLQKHPTRLVEYAVKGMMPKCTLSRQALRRLKIYAGTEHPHKAQLSQ